MLHQLLDFLRSLTNPDQLIQLLTTVFAGWWGYALLFGIVFSRPAFWSVSSCLVTACSSLSASSPAPADSTSSPSSSRSSVPPCSVTPRLFPRPLHRCPPLCQPQFPYLPPAPLEQTQAFYEKHGGKTIIYAQFLPIIRTFAAFVAGVAGMGCPLPLIQRLRQRGLGCLHDPARLQPRQRPARSRALREGLILIIDFAFARYLPRSEIASPYT